MIINKNHYIPPPLPPLGILSIIPLPLPLIPLPPLIVFIMTCIMLMNGSILLALPLPGIFFLFA